MSGNYSTDTSKARVIKRQLLQSVTAQIAALHVLHSLMLHWLPLLSVLPLLISILFLIWYPCFQEIDKETERARERLGRMRSGQRQGGLKQKRERGGEALPQSSPTSAGALNGWRLHTKPPSGSQCVHVPVSAQPGLNIFPQFANVAQVLQPDPQPVPAPFLYTRFTFLWVVEVGGGYVCVRVCVCERVGG